MPDKNRSVLRSSCVVATLVTILVLGVICFCLPPQLGRYGIKELNTWMRTCSVQPIALGKPGDELVTVDMPTRGPLGTTQAVALWNKDQGTLTFLTASGQVLALKPGEKIQQSSEGNYLRLGEQVIEAQTGQPAAADPATRWRELSSGVGSASNMDGDFGYRVALSNNFLPYLFGDWEMFVDDDLNPSDQFRPFYRGTGRPLKVGWMPDQRSVAIQTDQSLFILRIR